MKKIVLIGDSTRMGYDKYVKEALDGVAEVYYPNENCRFASYVLRFAHDWKARGNWPDDVDLVHWNAGLWDAIELFGDEPLTPISCYADTILRIHKRIRMIYPNAKIVFATSTTVWEEKCSADFKRHNSVIAQYNKAAIDALSDTDTLINDLYNVTANAPLSYHSDSVHYYTDEGTQLLGDAVLFVICKELGICPKDVKIENFDPEKYTKDNIGY